MRVISRGRFCVVLAALIAAAGCAKGPPPDFYILNAATSESNVGAKRGISVGVGPIDLPAHLNRSQIVTRATDYQLTLSDSHQWAEPLKDSVSRVLVINLSNMLETNRVYVIPRRQRVPLDFQVSIDIERLDGRLGEEVILGARWILRGSSTHEPLLNQITIVKEIPEDGTYNALVAASSRTLEILSTEIADAINARR
jgi:uncharacterized lipoprotein YmbA